MEDGAGRTVSMRMEPWSIGVRASKIRRSDPVGGPERSGEGKVDPSRLKRACQEFESLFLQYLMKVMGQGLPKAGLMDGGRGEEIYRSLLEEELARRMASAGGIGLAEVLYRRFQTERRGVKGSESLSIPAEGVTIGTAERTNP